MRVPCLGGSQVETSEWVVVRVTFLDADVVPQCGLDSSGDAEGKRVVAFSLVREDNVQQKFVHFCAPHFAKSDSRFSPGKGDPHSSASANGIARDRALDQSLKDPPPLPRWAVAEERRTSRVDIEVRDSPDNSTTLLTTCPVQTLYASTPIDASLLGLYIHQNYTQYCSSIEQCSSLVDNLSWTDANGSENVRV